MYDLGSNAGGTDTEDWADLLDEAPCGYISMTPDARIRIVNGTLRRWLGLAPDALVGRRFHDLLTVAGKIYYETHFAPLLRMQGFFNEVALDLVRADGSRLPALVNASERRDDAGGVRFIRITVFDATDRRRYEQELLATRQAAERAREELQALAAQLEARVATEVAERIATEERLRQSEKMDAIGRLTGGIAHDFNNMLTVVISGLNLLQRRLARGDTEVGELIAAAMDGASRAAGLTQRLLAFARQQPLAPEPVDANQMVGALTKLLRSMLGELVQVETLFAPGLWRTLVDPNQLENAIVNLAANARDAMPQGGRLTIATSNAPMKAGGDGGQTGATGDHVRIAVSDTGAGMSEGTIVNAFEPFFTTKAVGKGTGLGLSQVFGFVKQSGGQVEIRSELGRGTTVELLLPRFRGNTEQPRPAAPSGPASGSAAEVVLVVEDEPSVRELTAAMVRELGYGLLVAANGEEALGLLSAHPEVRLLLSDVVMPEGDGRALAEAAKRLRPDLKVLFMSGYPGPPAGRGGGAATDTPLLQKPATLQALAAKLRATLDAP